jgi:hypothetical protein
VRADGSLRQALTSTGSEAIRETYISTGAPYWAMQAFGGLWSMRDDDPFWTCEPEPLPIEQVDVHSVFTQPGWILSGTRESGEVHRFTLHTAHSAAKYAKFVYSTAAPYNAGLGDGSPTPDAMIGIEVDGHVSHRTGNESAAIHEDGWIRYRHCHEIAGVEALFDTIVLPDGDAHLRVHRLVETNAQGTLATVEGAAALGFDHGDLPHLLCDPTAGTSGGVSNEHAVAIRVWDEIRRPRLPRAFADGGTGNVVHSCNVIPFVSGEMRPGDVIMSTVFLGTARQARDRSLQSLLGSRPTVTWREDDGVEIDWRDRTFVVTPQSMGNRAEPFTTENI